MVRLLKQIAMIVPFSFGADGLHIIRTLYLVKN